MAFSPKVGDETQARPVQAAFHGRTAKAEKRAAFLYGQAIDLLEDQDLPILKGESCHGPRNLVLSDQGSKGILLGTPSGSLSQLCQGLHAFGLSSPSSMLPIDRVPCDGEEPAEGRPIAMKTGSILPR